MASRSNAGRTGIKSLGGISVREVHSRSFHPGARCPCGARPVCVGKTFLGMDEALKAPAFQLLAATQPELVRDQVVRLWDGPMLKDFVLVGTMYACADHKHTMQKAAAKGPSHVAFVMEDEPNPTNRILVGL